MLLFYIVIGVTFIGMLYTIFVVFRPNNADEDETSTESSATGKTRRKDSGEKKGTNKSKAKASKTRTTSVSEEKHPWLVSVFKGHSENITGLHLSSNEKFLASCALDRTVLIWHAKEKDLISKDKRNVRVNIPFDSASQVYWSPDSKAFVISRVNEKILEVYKLGKKPDGSLGNITRAQQFQKLHEEPIVGLGIACHGKFMVSGSADGKIVIWNLKGTILEEVKFAGSELFRVKVSNCGRYFAACGASQELSVYEVIFNYEQYKETKVKWKLTGHDCGVCDLDFNADSSKILTVTEKGFWRMFDTTGSRVNVTCKGTVGESSASDTKPTIALSPDSRIIAVGLNNTVHQFLATLNEPGALTSSWTLPCDNVNALMFSNDGKFLLAGSDKNIRVFYNIAGRLATTIDLKLKMQDSTISQTIRTRLGQDLLEVEKDIKSLKVD